MNPATGTFTSPDAYAGTIFDPVSLHKYLYANANPVMNRDPSGYYTLTEMQSAMAIQAILGAAMNSIPKGIMRLLNGAPMDGNFWFTFAADFIVGFEVGAFFGWFGYMATQYLLASYLLRCLFGTMGVKFTWDAIQDLRRGDWGRAILNGLSAVLFFWGASQNYYKGNGLGTHGGNKGKNNPADDVADDAASVLDDASQAAYKAADYVDDFSVSNKHLLDAGGTWQKFATNDKSVINNWIKDALNSPNAQFLPNNIDGSYRIVTDLGYTVGSKGETTIRVVIGADGKIWTAFPV